MSHSAQPTFLPEKVTIPVVKPGEFKFAAMHLDHPHIFGQCSMLIAAGGELVAVYDPDPAQIEAFHKHFPGINAVADREAILEDHSIQLITAAAIPSERGALGCQVMRHGKDYFTDKAPFTQLDQLEQARSACEKTGRKYMVNYGERLNSECGVAAGFLIEQGAIGKVIHVEGTGPHRISSKSRPAWFFEKKKYGGILCDIASHQLEQFLFYTGNTEAEIQSARVSNYNNPQHPELEDFGDLTVVGGNGASGYHRVDWFTPKGLRTWGDGRTILIGTEGYIELRKYINVAAEQSGDHLFLVNGEGEQHFELTGKVGSPFYPAFILDCLNRTEHAMTQAHAFLAAELSLKAQALADQGRKL